MTLTPELKEKTIKHVIQLGSGWLLFQMLLVTLKAMGPLDYASWWLILAPILWPFYLIIFLGLIFVILTACIWILDQMKIRQRRRLREQRARNERLDAKLSRYRKG
jgi:uncharacterized membrane protein